MKKIIFALTILLYTTACTPSPTSSVVSNVTTGNNSINYTTTWTNNSVGEITRTTVDSSIDFSTNTTNIVYKKKQESQEKKNYHIISQSTHFEQKNNYCTYSFGYDNRKYDNKGNLKGSSILLHNRLSDTTCSIDSLLYAQVNTLIIGDLHQQLLTTLPSDTLKNCIQKPLNDTLQLHFCYKLYKTGAEYKWTYDKVYNAGMDNYVWITNYQDTLRSSITLGIQIANWNTNSVVFKRGINRSLTNIPNGSK